MTRILLTGLAALMLAAGPGAMAGTSAGSVACAPRAALAAGLGEVYGEAHRGSGLRADGVLLELFVATSGSWTVLVTRPDGIACIAATGRAWTPARKAPEGDPA